MKYQLKIIIFSISIIGCSSWLHAQDDIHKPNFRALADLARSINQNVIAISEKDQDKQGDFAYHDNEQPDMNLDFEDAEQD